MRRGDVRDLPHKSIPARPSAAGHERVEGGRHLQSGLESFVTCSGRIVLECECGEKLVLLGREDDWRSERTVFECGGCRQELTLADRTEEEAFSMGELLRGRTKPGSQG